MALANSSIEDVCAVIGFTATVRLIDWYGGANVYVPGEATEEHPLALLLGAPALRALCREFGSETLWVPREIHEPKVHSKLRVARVLRAGHGARVAAQLLGISERQVQRARRDLERRGVLPEVLPGNPTGKTA